MEVRELSNNDPILSFQSAMADAGLYCPEIPIADGNIHRFKADGDKKESCGYVLHSDGIPGGAFWSFKLGIKETWSLKNNKEFTPQERAVFAKRMAEAEKARKKLEALRHKATRAEAERLWGNAKPETGDHKYLMAKGVNAYGVKSDGLNLLLSVRDIDGILHGLQTIDPTGSKLFLPGTAKSGHYFSIGKPKDTLIIVEGYSTGASIHMATGHAVAVAFDAGNLLSVAKVLRERFPDIEIIIAGDNDA